VSALPQNAWGEAAQSEPVRLQYPELQVTPLASQRLDMEAQKESSLAWTTHLPIQVSALSTIAAGAMMLGENKDQMSGDHKDQANYAALTGLAVGAGWLGVTTYMASNYRPYATGQQEVAALAPGKGKDKEALVRERMAEEAIDRAASVGRRLTWLSVATNLAANGYIIGSSDNNGTKAVAGLAALTAFAPVLFSYRWNHVAAQHELYKKRIYAPIVMGGWQVRDGQAAPMVLAHLSF
jgi:hypothetical protein